MFQWLTIVITNITPYMITDTTTDSLDLFNTKKKKNKIL